LSLKRKEANLFDDSLAGDLSEMMIDARSFNFKK